MTYYELLGVHPDASAHAIKVAYRRLVKIHHPDYNPQEHEAAEHNMKLLNEAYRTLSKPDLRRSYDASLNKPEEVQFKEPKPRRKDSRPFRPPSMPTSNRFEGKDAFVGLIATFLLLVRLSPVQLQDLGNWIILSGFFLLAFLLAQLTRRISRLYFAWGFPGHEHGTAVVVLSHFSAAILLSIAADQIEIVLDQVIFARPLLPALISVIIPSTMGAGVGRAINRTLGAFWGILGGAATGFLISIGFALLCLVAQIAYLGVNSLGADVDTVIYPARAVGLGALLAAGLGSFRQRGQVLFSLVEWMEDLFGGFGPRSKWPVDSQG
ncbi:MAG: J domain-containing protein [Bdellovibrionales bacterium]